MNVVFAPSAMQEVAEACDWYSGWSEELAQELVDELTATLQRLREHPLASPLKYHDIRKAVMTRFPYNIWYVYEDETIFVQAFAHQKREPLYWIGRLQ